MTKLVNITKEHIGIILILVFSLLLNVKLISYELPFFSDEDEAHHHNRQVEMLKTQDLNPRYFLKPSLNFYSRLPALYSGYLLAKSRGELNNLEEIKTKDKYGIAGYSFVANPVELIKSNRFFSVLIFLGIIFLSYIITLKLVESSLLASFAGLLCAVSPLELAHSTSIGVNQPTAFLCLLCVYFAISNKNNRYIYYSTIFAGLAISTKYNALPIILVPYLSLLLNKDLNIKKIFTVGIVSLIAFFAVSPFILIESALFIKHVTYEAWHYGVAGHAGHMANPGIDQIIFYFLSFSLREIGILPLALCLYAMLLTLKNRNHNKLLLLIFPAGFFLLMITQKANFIRNMLLILPFLCIFCAISLNCFKNNKYLPVFLLLILIQPLWISSLDISQKLSHEDSRSLAYKHVHNENIENIAIDGELWMPSFTKKQNGKTIHSINGATRLNLNTITAEELFLDGFDYVLFGPYAEKLTNTKSLTSLSIFNGSKEKQRLVVNPKINFAKLNKKLILNSIFNSKNLIEENKIIKFKFENNMCIPDLSKNIWLTKRLMKIDISECKTNNSITNIRLIAFTPWANQKLSIISKNRSFGTHTFNSSKDKNVFFSIPKRDINTNELFIFVSKLQSPFSHNISSDIRKLALELK